MGQQESAIRHKQFELPVKQVRKADINQSYVRVQHEGILKLRDMPFRNSVEISHHPPLFLESADVTLADLLQTRYNTTKLFTEEDIVKLAESILYTLSYLQTKKLSYPDLSMQNIYYDTQSGAFKLLPVQLIKESAYYMAKTGKKFSYLGPELVLALRYGQNNIQNDIMDKANVFTLGMILLEVLTLRSSQQCYDAQTYDILDEVVGSRLELAREFYPEFLVRVVSLMLDYDYTERYDLKRLSIELNRQLRESRIVVKPQHKMTATCQQSQVSTASSNVQYRPQPANLTRSQLKYQPREQPPQQHVMPPQIPQLRSAMSSQYPSASQGLSPSRVQIDRHYSQPAQHFQPYQNNVSNYGYVTQAQSYPSNHYYNMEAETPRYNPIDNQEEASLDTTPQYTQPYEQSPYQIAQPAQPSYMQPNHIQHQYSYPAVQNTYEQPRQAAHQINNHFNNQSGVNFSQEEVYRSPIDESRQPKPSRNFSTPTKYPASSYRIGIIQQPENCIQPNNNPYQRQSPRQTVLKDVNQSTSGPDKSPNKPRRNEYVSPIQQDELTDNSISRLKEQIEKSRKLIMQFQRMQGITDSVENSSKNKRFLPA